MLARKKLLVVGLLALMFTMFVGSGLVFAQAQKTKANVTTAPGASNDYDVKKWAALIAGLTIAIAAFGGALGQGNTAGKAMEGIARNPGASKEMFVPFILGMALIESLVLFAFLISFLIYNKI